MSLVRVSVGDKARGFKKMVSNKLAGRPLGTTLELTRRCNARCDYCGHWQEPKRNELDTDGWVDVVRTIDPLAVTICGGEPFMRRDCLEIVRRIKALPGYRYVAIITNGHFLSRERAGALLDTGIDQVNVSLNYPDERQDGDRQLKGLYKKIEDIVPWMTSRGAEVQLNSILMRDNLDDILGIADRARTWGARMLVTLYSELPGANHEHVFTKDDLARVAKLCKQLIHLRRTESLVANEEWYLEKIPDYLAGERIGGCTAGRTSVHVTPEGMIRPCAELEPVAHYSTFRAKDQPHLDCTACFQACRGEAQAPLTPKRIVQYLIGPNAVGDGTIRTSAGPEPTLQAAAPARTGIYPIRKAAGGE
jgi:MoaA/NifB/PqqE/SkfB family radical SAM enzyme